MAGVKVASVIRVDGTKMVLSDVSWLLFRKSGTDPVVRFYGEAATSGRLAEVVQAGREFIIKD